MSKSIIAPERLSHLIGLIYDCAVDSARWPVAMEAIRLELACHNATLDLVELPSGASLTSAACNIPAAYLPLLASAGPDVVEQWGGEERMRTLPLDEPAVMSRVNPDFTAMTGRNRYFLDFAQPQGLVDVIAIPMARDSRGVGALAFGRHVDQGSIGAREVAVARLLVPHIQRAAAINRVIDRETGLRLTFAATLDALSAPTALIGLDCSLVHANPAFQRLAAQDGPLRLTAGRLAIGEKSASQLLAATLEQVRRGEMPSRGLSIPLEGAHGEGGALHVLPMPHPADARSAAVAVFAAARLVSPAGMTRLVAKRYRLTPREMSVFEHLVTGRSQAEVAESLAIGISTVKTHLGRIYEKLGVRSQAGLMAVAASLSIPLVG